jgi:hypothetical protein
MEIIKGRVRVEWVDLGEGLDGDYDPDDPNDVALLRFDVSWKNLQGEWEAADDASYCTDVPTATPLPVQQRLLEILMDEVYEPLTDRHSIKKLCERLSWISPNWVDDKTPIWTGGK